MANDNVIDELSLQIDANASAALKNLGKMQTQLRNLAKAIGTVSAAGKSLTGISTAFNKIGSINTNNIGKAIDQLDRLSKINLKNLDGKQIKLDIHINGASEAERKLYAMQDAVKNIDTRALAKKFNEVFGLKGVDAKGIRDVYKQAVADMGAGGAPNGAFVEWLEKVEQNGLRLSKEAFSEDIGAMRSEYEGFLKYLSNNKIKLTQAVDKNTYLESTTANERMTFFNKNGSALDGRWEELAHLFPTIMSGMKNIANEEEQVYAILEKIREARAALSSVDIKDLTGVDSERAWSGLVDEVGNSSAELQRVFDAEVQKAMKESANKIPIDVTIDSSRIEQQIQSAISSAANRTYNLPIKFAINTDAIKGTVSTALGSIDVSSMGQLATNLREASAAMVAMSGTNPRESGLTNFVNAMARFASVDMSNFSTGSFSSIIDGIGRISEMGDISAGINRLVSSLARLASAGEKTEQSAKSLPRLGSAIREVMSGMTSAGALPSELNAFVSSIARLASAGTKVSVTAGQLEELGKALKKLMGDLQGAPMVSQNLIDMTTALGELANAGAKTGQAVRSMETEATKDVKAGTGIIDSAMQGLERTFTKAGNAIKTGASKIVQSFKQIRSSGNGLSSATQNIKTLIGAMVGYRGIFGAINLSKQVVMLGANMTEIDHIVESVFGDMAGYADTWAKSAITSFGIAEHSAKQYAGTLSAMFQASGVGYKDAGKMGMELVGLAGDLSAFYNIDTETAFNKIRSGMAGMVRPLRDLGIDLTAATLEEFRLSQGIQTSYSAMSQAEKVMLRYQYLMANTTLQQSDFQRTSKSLANSLRTLKAYAQAVGTQIGIGLASAIRHIIVWLNELMKIVLKAAQAFATFMQTIFGKYKGGASGIATDMSGMEEDMSGLNDSTEGVADSLDNASDAAKQLKKDLSVLPFDELNQLNKDMNETSSGAGTGGAGTGGAGGGIGDGLLDWGDLLNNSEAGKLPDAISAWAKRIKDAFNARDWEKLGEEIAWGLNKGIDKLYDVLDPEKFKKKVAPWIDAFTTTFNSLVDHINWEKMGRTVGRGINDVIFVLNRAIEGIDWQNLGKKLGEGANGLVDEVDFEQVGNFIGNKFMIIWNILYGFAHEFDWDRLGEQLGNGVNGLNDKINWSIVADALTTSLNGLFTALLNFTRTVDWDGIAANITNGLNTAIHNFDWKNNGKAVGEFVNNLLDAILYVVDNTDWTGIGEGIADFLQQIPWGKLLATVAHTFVKVFGGLIKGMAKTPAGLFAEGLMFALALYKITTGQWMPFINTLWRSFSGAAKDATIWDKMAGLIGGKLKGALGSLKGLELGSAFLEAGGFVALMVGAEKLSKGIDKLKGGNGILSDMGTALHEYVDRLGQTAVITGEQADDLSRTIETMESAGASEAEIVQAVMNQLMGMGVPYETAKGYLEQFKISTDNNAEALKAVETGMDNVYGKAEAAETPLATYKDGMDKIRDAVYQAAEKNEGYRANLENILGACSAAEGANSTLAEAYEDVRKYIEAAGLEVEDFDEILGTDFANAAQNSTNDAGKIKDNVQSVWDKFVEAGQGISRSLHDGARSNAAALDAHAGKLEEFEQKVQDYYDGISNSLQGLGEGWGQLAADQEDSLDAVYSNLQGMNGKLELQNQQLEQLMSSGMDAALVQTILNEIPLGSGAMTEFLAEMGKDSPEYHNMKSEIEKNMDLRENIPRVLDAAATEYANGIAPAFGVVQGSVQTESGKIGSLMVTGIAGGVYSSVSEATTAMRDMADKMIEEADRDFQINSPSKVMFEKGMYLMQGLASGISSNMYQVTQAIGVLNKAIQVALDGAMSDWTGAGKKVVQMLASGIRTNTSLVSQAFQGINGFMRSEQNTLKLYGTSMGKNLVDGFSKEASRMKSAATGALSNVRSELGHAQTDFYNSGKNLSQSLANGFGSVSIPTPHMVITGWNWFDMGDGSGFSTPTFGVDWYKAGGLFKGGRGQVVGIAENGKDEAVLPLENNRAMAQIGQAIANASGSGVGLTKDDIVEAVAEAMMANPQAQDVIVNAVLKTENDEVLARAVTRGQRRIDSRFNPVAQY